MHSTERVASDPFTDEERALLLRVARASIDHRLRTGRAIEIDPQRFPAALRAERASFVTLRRRDGTLRGCVGEIEASRTLVESVADRACAAAFHDSRFPPLAAEELDDVELHVSVLGPLTPIAAESEAALRAALRPGVDGLVIDDGVRRATFLPAVWESLPDPAAFLGELWRKAHIPAHVFPPSLRAWRYEVLELGEA